MFKEFVCQRCGNDCGSGETIKLAGQVYANLCRGCATDWHECVVSTEEWAELTEARIQIEHMELLASAGQAPSVDAVRSAYLRYDRATEGVRKVALEYVKRR